MYKFAFISRHTPTQGQIDLAAERSITLEHIGDMDAFTITPNSVAEKGEFSGVVVVHPAAALRVSSRYLVGVFENANRAPEGAPPQFEAQALHIYNGRCRTPEGASDFEKEFKGFDVSELFGGSGDYAMHSRFNDLNPTLLKTLQKMDNRLAKAYLAEVGITEDYLDVLLEE